MWPYYFSFFSVHFYHIWDHIAHYLSIHPIQKFLKFLCNITPDYFPMIVGSLNKNNWTGQKYVHFAFCNILTKLFPETLYQFPFPLAVLRDCLPPTFTFFLLHFWSFLFCFYCRLICFLIETMILNSTIFQPTTCLKFNLSWFPRIFFF